MEAKQIAKIIYNQVKNEGMSTSNCYAHDFKNNCKWFSKNRAETKYSGNLLKEILIEINKL